MNLREIDTYRTTFTDRALQKTFINSIYGIKVKNEDEEASACLDARFSILFSSRRLILE